MREFTSPAPVSPPPVGGLADVVFQYAEEDPRRVALGRKDAAGAWQDVTSADFRDEVLALAKGLPADGIRFGDRVAIMSRTRYEWTLFDFALWTIGAQVVPVHPHVVRRAVCWMPHDAEVTAAVVEHEDHAMTIATVIDRLPRMRRLWQLGSGAVQELYAAGAHLDDDVVHRKRRAVMPDTVATVIYTSGTTGRPKGCVLSHGNFMYEADTVMDRWEPVFHSRKGDRPSTLLFLPPAHVLGRMVEVAGIRGKVRFGHQPRLDAAALMPDLAAFRPTFILAVPYVFEKVFNAARRKAEAVEHWLSMRGEPVTGRTGAGRGAGGGGAAGGGDGQHPGLAGGVDPDLPDSGAAVHREARTAHAVAEVEAEAQGDREGLRRRGRGAVPHVRYRRTAGLHAPEVRSRARIVPSGMHHGR
ncbi:AMP-binding protein [Streptomyces pratens]|uniref:AMP-binding protein n=1 Tax=Streptomyces pratens TaxID=887456 RepID=A0ABW1M553_9ACTN